MTPRIHLVPLGAEEIPRFDWRLLRLRYDFGKRPDSYGLRTVYVVSSTAGVIGIAQLQRGISAPCFDYTKFVADSSHQFGEYLESSIPFRSTVSVALFLDRDCSDATYLRIIDRLVSHGFALWGSELALIDPPTERHPALQKIGYRKEPTPSRKMLREIIPSSDCPILRRINRQIAHLVARSFFHSGRYGVGATDAAHLDTLSDFACALLCPERASESYIEAHRRRWNTYEWPVLEGVDDPRPGVGLTMGQAASLVAALALDSLDAGLAVREFLDPTEINSEAIGDEEARDEAEARPESHSPESRRALALLMHLAVGNLRRDLHGLTGKLDEPESLPLVKHLHSRSLRRFLSDLAGYSPLDKTMPRYLGTGDVVEDLFREAAGSTLRELLALIAIRTYGPIGELALDDALNTPVPAHAVAGDAKGQVDRPLAATV